MILDGHVPALDVACLIEGAAKRGRGTCHAIGRAAVDKGDDWHRRLLRARRQRQRGRRAAEQRNELAPPHSITSSAMARSDGGTARPSIRAVSALMTSSNLVACTTGKAAGFSPLRMRPA